MIWRPSVLLALGAIALTAGLTGCGPNRDSAALGVVTARDIPTATFNECHIPAGQPTWANVILTGGESPFRGVWSIDGKVDTTDPQRSVVLPGGETKLEILVTLAGNDDEFQLQAYNRHGPVGTSTWTNGQAAGDAICNSDGETILPVRS
jgi:hypothetical protein